MRQPDPRNHVGQVCTVFVDQDAQRGCGLGRRPREPRHQTIIRRAFGAKTENELTSPLYLAAGRQERGSCFTPGSASTTLSARTPRDRPPNPPPPL